MNMPIYEYECKKCGYKFEQLQKITDAPLHICPKCEEAHLVKLVSNTSFQLKGTGWYVTDFKDKNISGKKPKSETVPITTKTETKITGKSKTDMKK